MLIHPWTQLLSLLSEVTLKVSRVNRTQHRRWTHFLLNDCDQERSWLLWRNNMKRLTATTVQWRWWWKLRFHFKSFSSKFIHPKCLKNSTEYCTFLFLGKLGRQESAENFFNLPKVRYFFLHFFMGKNKYKIRVSVHCNVRNLSILKCIFWGTKMGSNVCM